MSEEDAEEKSLEDEQEAQAEVYKEWSSAVEAAADHVLDPHGLVLKKKGEKGIWYLSPEVSWRDSAERLRKTINGYGPFYFKDLNEFLESGPYTPREAVESHWHWARDYPEVYGEISAEAVYERRTR